MTRSMLGVDTRALAVAVAAQRGRLYADFSLAPLFQPACLGPGVRIVRVLAASTQRRPLPPAVCGTERSVLHSSLFPSSH